MFDPVTRTEHLWFLDTLVAVRVPHSGGVDGISVLEHRLRKMIRRRSTHLTPKFGIPMNQVKRWALTRMTRSSVSEHVAHPSPAPKMIDDSPSPLHFLEAARRVLVQQARDQRLIRQPLSERPLLDGI